MGRVGEKYAVWNMPDIGQIDKQIRKLGHYWVLVQRRGRARVYELSNNPFKDETYTKPICNIEWSALPANDPVYQRLDEHKWDKLEGEGEEYVPIDEVQRRVERAETDARRAARDQFIRAAYGQDLLSQPEIAEVVDLDQSTVSRVVNQEATA
jgi:predicted XRE-type DNA-binding protein